MVLTAVTILAVSVFAGVFGSLLGLGGGMIVVPVLTLAMGVDIKYAITAGLISVISTSSGSAIVYVRDKITNIRVGMFLELATTIGALSGALIAGFLEPKILYILFATQLFYSAYSMIKKRNQELPENRPLHPMAEKLNLQGEYYDKSLNQTVKYQAAGIYGGFGMMYIAGLISALLGIGSGSFKVIAMDHFMNLPMKVSSATSNFMMGVTAAASAGIYLFRGQIDPKIAGPVALGVVVGAAIGTRLMQRMKSVTLRKIFIPVLLYVAVEMLLQGLGVR